MAETSAISWRRDFDKTLGEARDQARSVLVDFTAAPM